MPPNTSVRLIHPLAKRMAEHDVRLSVTAARCLVDGDDAPLNDLSVLVQIPAVRKLVETMIYSEDQLISDRGLPSDEPDAYVEQWREALEATDG